eukprot:5812181-Pyramimonas_sp.AAC.1
MVEWPPSEAAAICARVVAPSGAEAARAASMEECERSDAPAMAAMNTPGGAFSCGLSTSGPPGPGACGNVAPTVPAR